MSYLSICYIIVSILVWLCPLPAISNERQFYLGTCQLASDPDQEEIGSPLFCIKGNSFIEGITTTEQGHGGEQLLDGYGYIGAYYSVLFSLHAKMQYRFTHVSQQETNSRVSYWQKRLLFLQAGNPVITRWRLLAGFIELPFGVNLRILPDAIDTFIKMSDRFFPDPVYGLSVAFQDLMGSQIELGLGDQSDFAKVGKNERNSFFSVRATRDISALNGVRFAASILQGPDDDRRLSVGMFNVSQTGAVTGLEWVRSGKKVSGVLSKSDQLIRFQYADNYAANKRWLFEYEDEFTNYWITSLGYEKSYPLWVRTKFGAVASYYKSRDEARHSHLVLTLGCGGEL